MKKGLLTLLFCLLFFPEICRGNGGEETWRLTVRTVPDRNVYFIGETVHFIFTLTDAGGVPRAGRELKIELWFDGKHYVRTFKTGERGGVQVDIRPETQCLVRCRAEYSAAVFAVGSATFSREPRAATRYKLRMKGRPGKRL